MLAKLVAANYSHNIASYKNYILKSQPDTLAATLCPLDNDFGPTFILHRLSLVNTSHPFSSLREMGYRYKSPYAPSTTLENQLEAGEPPNLKHKHQQVNGRCLPKAWLPDHIKQVFNCPNCNVKKIHDLKWNKNSDFGGVEQRESGRKLHKVNRSLLKL